MITSVPGRKASCAERILPSFLAQSAIFHWKGAGVSKGRGEFSHSAKSVISCLVSRAGQGRAGLRDAPQPRLRAGAALAVTVAMALSRVRQ
jgi:hypothetical protein